MESFRKPGLGMALGLVAATLATTAKIPVQGGGHQIAVH